MEVTGTVYKVLETQSGVSKSGNAWSRLTFVVEYGDQYPKKLAISLMNDKAQQYAPLIQPGARISVKYDASSREYENRWYTECVAWKVELAAQQQGFQMNQPYQQPQQMPHAYPQQGYQQPMQTQQPQGMYGQTQGYQQPVNPFGPVGSDLPI